MCAQCQTQHLVVGQTLLLVTAERHNYQEHFTGNEVLSPPLILCPYLLELMLFQSLSPYSQGAEVVLP